VALRSIRLALNAIMSAAPQLTTRWLSTERIRRKSGRHFVSLDAQECSMWLFKTALSLKFELRMTDILACEGVQSTVGNGSSKIER
jgi:hypothetical protein